MCTACDETYKIFSVELVTKEAINTNMELFKEIAHRLFQNKIISNINIDNNRVYEKNNKQIFGFDLHLGNVNNPEAVDLGDIQKALHGILDHFEVYSEMQIKLN